MRARAVWEQRLETSSVILVSLGTASTRKVQKISFDGNGVQPVDGLFQKQFHHVKVSGSC